MKGSPTILVVDNSRAVTGALNAVRHATQPLRPQFCFRYVVPAGSAATAILVADGYAVQELPFVEISRRPADLLRYVPMLLLNGWRLYRLARRTEASIIHLNDFYNLTGYVAKLLSFGKLRVVTHVRFLPQSLPQPLARTWRWLAEAGASQVVCVSEAVRRYFGPSARVQVVYDPLPSRAPQAPPAYPARPDGTVQLLYLSNYIQGKGQNFALEAFAQAHAHNPRLRLRLVGGDMGLEKNRDFRRQLEARAAQAQLHEAVEFAGFATDVAQEIRAADIVLNFSESESFSLTCLDALYYGTALIASDCGGPAELFEHGRSGWLVPNRDVGAMAAAISRLGADAGLRAAFAEAGQQYVSQKFAPAHTYGRLAAVYHRVLAAT